MSFSGGKNNPLNKRIPENPRYKNVKPVVDSGASVSKYLERLEEIKKDYKFKKDEIFRRIKCSTFIQLVLQIASVGIEDGQLTEECPIHSGMHTPTAHPQPHPSPPSTARSTLSDLVTGLGELDISNPDVSPLSTPQLSPVPSPSSQPSHCPYLLLDVREPEDFDKCHIITAHNYPARMLSRSVNPYTRELYEYKNKSESIIVVYDEDESVAHDVATKLVQRDFGNVFMLSGGLRVLYKSFPKGIIAGALPLKCYPSPLRSSGRKKPSETPKIHQDTEVRDYFTMDDLLILQQRLDEILLASTSSRTSSRSSSCMTSASRTSVASSRRPASQKMWKY